MLINFFGKRGAGKTTAINGQLQDCRGPVIVCDVLGNYLNKGYIEKSSTADAILWIEAWIKNPDQENKILVLQCADPNLSVDFMSAALWESGQGTLILDETDAFSIHEAECFDQLIRYGRNRNIDLITGVRRPAEIPRNITAGANQIYAFQTQEPRDVDYFRTTLFGSRADELMVLQEFHGLFLDYDRKEIGEFRIDKNGTIFKLKIEPINKTAPRKTEPQTRFEGV